MIPTSVRFLFMYDRLVYSKLEQGVNYTPVRVYIRILVSCEQALVRVNKQCEKGINMHMQLVDAQHSLRTRLSALSTEHSVSSQHVA